MPIDDIRGDGLVRAHRALLALEGDAHILDHARRRFEDSPPPYSPRHSHNSTRSQSSNPPSESQRIQDEREAAKMRARVASHPSTQFRDEQSEELNRIENETISGKCHLPAGTSARKLAYANTKQRWQERGIWSEKWDAMANGPWKHEEPLEDSDVEVATKDPPLFSAPKAPAPAPVQKTPQRDNIDRETRLRRARRAREREASRPFHQFIYQISRERDNIASRHGFTEKSYSSNINSQAYETVKRDWVERNIWIPGWGMLPGMHWFHETNMQEESIEEEIATEATAALSNGHTRESRPKTTSRRPAAQVNLLRDSPHEAELFSAGTTRSVAQQSRPHLPLPDLDAQEPRPHSTRPTAKSPIGLTEAEPLFRNKTTTLPATLPAASRKRQRVNPNLSPEPLQAESSRLPGSSKTSAQPGTASTARRSKRLRPLESSGPTGTELSTSSPPHESSRSIQNTTKGANGTSTGRSARSKKKTSSTGRPTRRTKR